LNRQWADVELKKGILLSSPGRWDDAVLQYDKALRLQSDDLMARYFLAYVLLERNRDGDPQSSVELLKRVAAVEPDYAYVHLKLSRARELTGDPVGAEREMTAAIRQDPLLAQETGDFKKARELFRLGDHTQALALYQALALRHPLCPPLWYEIGVTCTMLKRYEDAIYAYKRALSIYPTYVDALRNLGYVASTVGMMDEVLRVMDTLRRTFPDQPWVNELERQFGEAVPTPSKGPRN
jgi:tetratricopeptide (TPR) repeat protein